VFSRVRVFGRLFGEIPLFKNISKIVCYVKTMNVGIVTFT
jgi:hypothetical protein